MRKLPLAFLLAWLLAGPALAALPSPDSSLPAPTGQAHVRSVLGAQTVNLGPDGAHLATSTSLNGLGSSAATADLLLGPVPQLSVSADKTGFANADASAILNYQVRAITTLPINPAALPIPIIYTAQLRAEASASSPLSNATAQVLLSDEQHLITSGHSHAVCASAGGNCFLAVPAPAGPLPAVLSVSGALSLPLDDLITVSLVAQSFAMADNASAVHARAFVDPVFSIDPVFAAAHPGLSLQISVGVGNGLPVPEPASAALLALGLAALGLGQRRAARPARA
jgi:hypothetical protein